MRRLKPKDELDEAIENIVQFLEEDAKMRGYCIMCGVFYHEFECTLARLKAAYAKREKR